MKPGLVGPFLLLLASHAIGAAAAATVRGIVQGGERKPQKGPCPRLNCEWMEFIIRKEGTETIVPVRMQKRVIEGTVFVNRDVVVEGEWKGPRLEADRITDLHTGATIGHESGSLRYPVAPLTLEGEVDEVQSKEEPHRGQINKREKWRFLLKTNGERPLVAVEIVKPMIRGILRQNELVRVEGRWTDRNVLRADRVFVTSTGEIID